MHLFFTGAKGVGKSTLIRKLTGQFPGKTGGFRTVRLNTYLPGRYTVHLLSPATGQEPGEENLLFLCENPGEDTLARFDRLGCRALEAPADLLVMDELGPHEASAAGFQGAVRAALKGNTPILGVLQQAEDTFLQELAGHPKVKLITVTKENREELAARIPELLAILQKGGD